MKLLSTVRHRGALTPGGELRDYWTLLLLPGTRFAIGACIQRANDGHWTHKGASCQWFMNRDRVWQFRFREWLLWIYKNRIKLPDQRGCE